MLGVFEIKVFRNRLKEIQCFRSRQANRNYDRSISQKDYGAKFKRSVKLSATDNKKGNMERSYEEDLGELGLAWFYL
jgi:hypothetical protein